jgi:phosphopantothenoylcysteine synthetase/decarboxylase
MRILVTAGNTQVLVDQVRCLTNVFTGRTGAAIALCAFERGHHVTLLTSHPEAVAQVQGATPVPGVPRWTCNPYRTFHDLANSMEQQIRGGRYDALIHCAAVSDYLSAGVFAAATGTLFETMDHTWQGSPPRLVDRAAAKVKSDEPELWLRLVRAPKLVDQVRQPWGFAGLLVKFKLEVGVSDETLLAVAERSRQQSRADWMVANTLEGSAEWAYLGSAQGYERVGRGDLPRRLLVAIETQLEGTAHG